jgi:hypothetical protein
VTIARLGPADADRAVALAVDRGWSPEHAKCELLLEVGEGYGIEDGTAGWPVRSCSRASRPN